MCNGRVGHFKFVNVQEMRSGDQKANKSGLKLNQLLPLTAESEEMHMHLDDTYRRMLDPTDPDRHLVYDRLRQRLIDSDQCQNALTFNEIKQTIGLSDVNSKLLSIYGLNNLRGISRIANNDILNECGLRDGITQARLLLTARLLRDYYFCADDLNGQNSSSQWCSARKREVRCVSAPSTPAITPCVDFLANDFAQLLHKLDSVSTSSLDISGVGSAQKSSASDGTQQTATEDNQRLYENVEQIIGSSHDLTLNSSKFLIKSQ